MDKAKRRRVFLFFLTITIGICAGLAFGWLLMPPQAPTKASLDDLRADYKADLVLMTAVKFLAAPDPMNALDQLARIDAGDPLTLLVNAINYAGKVGYASDDIQVMQALFSGIDAQSYQLWLTERGK